MLVDHLRRGQVERRFLTYPEKGTARAIGAREFHGCSITPVKQIVAYRDQFGDWNQFILRYASSDDQLHAGITTFGALSRPVILGCRVRHHIVDGGMLSIGTTRLLGGDGVVLCLPIAGHVLGM